LVACGASRLPEAAENQEGTALPREEQDAREEPLPPLYEITDKVEIQTTLGNVIVGLYGDNAPDTVYNFLKYVDRGFYAEKVFHRVIPGFMIQGGGFDADLVRAETEEPIRLEVIPGIRHVAGTISMARTSDPHSASSQFFVCVADSPQLNGIYAAFGEVLEGLDVIQAIADIPTTTTQTEAGPMADVPVNPIVIIAIERVD
jgi:cyclophilin family peptidyl-prolyl cis-trans isomerase